MGYAMVWYLALCVVAGDVVLPILVALHLTRRDRQYVDATLCALLWCALMVFTFGPLGRAFVAVML